MKMAGPLGLQPFNLRMELALQACFSWGLLPGQLPTRCKRVVTASMLFRTDSDAVLCCCDATIVVMIC